MSSNQSGGLPSSDYKVSPDLGQVSVNFSKSNRPQSPTHKPNPSADSISSYDYNRPNPSILETSKPTLGLDRIFKKEGSSDVKVIPDRDKSPKGLSRESTPTRANLTTPDISKPGVKASPKPKTTGTSDIGQFDKTKTPPSEAVSDVPSKISEGKASRSNSFEPPRQGLPTMPNNLGVVGNSGNISENLQGRFNSVSDDPQNLNGPGPALINSINKALEEGKNKGLLSEADNQKRSTSQKRSSSKSKPRVADAVINLDPASFPPTNNVNNQVSEPFKFPNNPNTQPQNNSKENTFRNLNFEEKKRDGSLGRGERENVRENKPEEFYSDTNNQDTVKKAGVRGRAPASDKQFASDSENPQSQGNKLGSPLNTQESTGGRENYHKGYGNIWNDQSNRDGLQIKNSPPKKDQKSNISTPPRSENGSKERKDRGSSDKKRPNKDSPGKYITIESGPKITGDSQRGSFRDSGPNQSHMQASFQDTHPKKESKVTSNPTPQVENGGIDFAFLNSGPMRPNLAMPNFGPDLNVMEVQNYLLFIMNFYEIHMNNLKGIIIQQNETITAQKAKIRKSDDAIEEFREKIEILQNNIRIQKDQYDQSYEELQDKHRQALDELLIFKKNVDHISKQMDNSILKEELDKSQNVHNVSALEIDGNNNKANRMILSEIQEIRKELEYQRELINDFKYTKNSLEHQIKDLERIYHDELRQNADFASRHDQMANTMKKYRDSYNKLDRLNKIISDGYERTRKELDTVRNSFAPEEDNFRRDRRYSPSPQHYQQPSQNYLDQNQSPSQYGKLDRPRYRSMTPPHGNQGPEENAYEAIKKKMKERDDQAKALLYPQGTQSRSQNSGNDNYYNNAKSPSSTLNDRDPNFQIRLNRSPPPQQDRRERERDSPIRQQQQYQPQYQQQQQRNYGIMPSYQKYEDNREEIRSLEELLIELTQDKKLLENDLFRLPSTGGNIEQKKKKTALERDLEDVDSRIEECRNRLRSLDALNIR